MLDQLAAVLPVHVFVLENFVKLVMIPPDPRSRDCHHYAARRAHESKSVLCNIPRFDTRFKGFYGSLRFTP